MVTSKGLPNLEEANALYEQHGKPLEADHMGQYLAVSPDGRTLVGATLLDVAQRARAEFGSGNFLFRIGTRTVGKLR
jgi:hypothetical protein